VFRQNAWKDWLEKIELEERFNVSSVQVYSVDKMGPSIGFIKFNANIQTSEGQRLPGICFMRGASVGVLVLLIDANARETYVAVLRLPRVPIATFESFELPAGIVKDEGPLAAATGVMMEKLGFEFLLENPLINLNAAFYGKDSLKPIYLSTGGSDEGMVFFACETLLSSEQIASIKKDLNQHKDIKAIHLIPFDQVLTQSQDSKLWIAMNMYSNLMRRNGLEPGKDIAQSLTSLKKFDSFSSLAKFN